jgi:4-alpha-glucanotransferase
MTTMLESRELFSVVPKKGEIMELNRSAGVFLHPTSLASPFGIGDLGAAAFEWVTLLAKAGQGYWQVCPLGPTGYGDSPYQCLSAFAGNELLISPVKLMEEGLLSRADIDAFPALPEEYVDFGAVGREKEKLFRKAFASFANSDDFDRFCSEEKYWLDNYTLFRVIKRKNDLKAWNEWDTALKLSYPATLTSLKEFEQDEIRYQQFLQFLFHRQWSQLKAYAGSLGVRIMGDIPIYAAFDSADAWSMPDYFEFDEACNPTRVAGVPPDYFSATGQLWGNPLYKWDDMRDNRYSWWIARIKKGLQMVDVIRIDHFRGFDSYWAVPANRPDAVQGEWLPGPGIDFFNQVRHVLGDLPLIAEDLGNITPQVIGLRKAVGIPGMKVLQFAFDGDQTNWHLPYNIVTDNIVYTGTHDNDTSFGWFLKLQKKDKEKVLDYLGCREQDMAEEFVRLAYSTPGYLCVVPLQDILGLDSSHRMNTPGTMAGNWKWRVTLDMLGQHGLYKMDMAKDFARIYGRMSRLQAKTA